MRHVVMASVVTLALSTFSAGLRPAVAAPIALSPTHVNNPCTGELVSGRQRVSVSSGANTTTVRKYFTSYDGTVTYTITNTQMTAGTDSITIIKKHWTGQGLDWWFSSDNVDGVVRTSSTPCP